jgi:hypothetical protein
MPNPNPWKARLAKALRAKPLSIDALLRLDSHALILAYFDVVDAPDSEARRKAILAYAAISGKVSRHLELVELEARVLALEQMSAERNGYHG